MNRTVSRRRFLATTSATLAAAFFARTARAGDAKPEGGLKIGIQSYSLRKFSIPEVIRHAKGLGLQQIEFSGAHLKVDGPPQQLEEVLSALRAADMQWTGYGVSRFTADHEANRKVFEFGKRAGVKILTANPEPAALDSLEKLVEEYQIRIAIHNHGPGALYDQLKDVTQAVAGRHPLLGVCVDTGHTLRSNEDPVEWLRTLGPRVYGVHLKDVAEKQDRTRNVVLGRGHLDVQGVFRTLREIQFPAFGALSIEYEANPDNPIDDIRQCLAVTEKVQAELAR